MLERKRANFILNEANFAGGYMLSGEKFNEVQDKIGRLQPSDENLKRLLVVIAAQGSAAVAISF